MIHAWHRPAGAEGVAWNGELPRPVGVAWSGRTDDRGMAIVPVAGAGEWLLGVVHMVASSDPVAADWESTWASLAFVRQPLRP